MFQPAHLLRAVSLAEVHARRVGIAPAKGQVPCGTRPEIRPARPPDSARHSPCPCPDAPHARRSASGTSAAPAQPALAWEEETDPRAEASGAPSGRGALSKLLTNRAAEDLGEKRRDGVPQLQSLLRGTTARDRHVVRKGLQATDLPHGKTAVLPVERPDGGSRLRLDGPRGAVLGELEQEAPVAPAPPEQLQALASVRVIEIVAPLRDGREQVSPLAADLGASPPDRDARRPERPRPCGKWACPGGTDRGASRQETDA